ncbi:N-acetylmuramoyl-L-alanine amidase [Flavobacterium columnare]|uniref:N-acetylmuramoyl-L-alanine amidase n=1 Tax=Flavobacterium columnare TaxID=996 RepID=A0AAI8CFW2_9FLAO|nr:N-acetylmuramoyl-L-alanine amidase [Flavobacterium columnare]AMO19416.1 N-acetylmuramoyl-L-alanine amidase [Flavobacterium columnare]AUX17356.1 N-acetylmuramoyl-L-alanine amidase [Flavobacterium columnare]QOG56378.1 N-acetylmuramoyl-L-alanine amidase [Flavobacterium columnare]QOG59102.1 N-acetylmuramoyl-L-alanine amidase [Flavobacterium columnare]QOG61823.1 N-acetylmuramoyl-L-alanine amidase [Flavobacterium columnare]
MRTIKYIAVHCTATTQKTSISAIQSYWKNQLGWKMPGYHFIVLPDGTAVQLLPIEEVSNGVQGFNSVLINIAYLGGVDAKNKPLDNRTPQQKATLLELLKKYKKQFPKAIIQGHRDFPNVKKACPSFDAKKEYQSLKTI